MKISGIFVLFTAAMVSPGAPDDRSINTSAAASHDTADPAKTAIEKIVREYILQHPEILIESVQQYQDRLRAAQKERTNEALASKLTELQRDPSSPTVGAAGGATVVEFFDYRCGFCKKAESAMTKLIAVHPDVQFVFKEFPILGPDSLMAAKAGLAAHRQGGYLKFHQGLMALSGPVTMEAIEALAGKQNLDIARLRTDMESSEVGAVLEKNRRLAQEVGVTATPAFVVNSELITGAVDAPALEKSIAHAKLNSAEPAKIGAPQ